MQIVDEMKSSKKDKVIYRVSKSTIVTTTSPLRSPCFEDFPKDYQKGGKYQNPFELLPIPNGLSKIGAVLSLELDVRLQRKLVLLSS